jgi:DNA-binding transcriptional regulator YiaG
VPVYVEDNFPTSRKGARVALKDNDDRVVGPGGDVIGIMEREVAKQWVLRLVERERDPATIKPEEIHGILLVLGITKSDFAKLLRVSKGSVTKYIDGSLAPTPPVAQLMLIYLAAELTKAGTVKAILAEQKVLLLGLRLTVPAPKFTIGSAA